MHELLNDFPDGTWLHRPVSCLSLSKTAQTLDKITNTLHVLCVNPIYFSNRILALKCEVNRRKRTQAFLHLSSFSFKIRGACFCCCCCGRRSFGDFKCDFDLNRVLIELFRNQSIKRYDYNALDTDKFWICR